MNNYERILKGVNLYPSINDKYVSLVLGVNIKNDYKTIFDVDYSFDEFIDKLKNDSEYLDAMVSKFNYYYGVNMELITNSSYDNWYMVNYKDSVKDNE